MKNHQPRLRVVAWVFLNYRIFSSGFFSRARIGAVNSHCGDGKSALQDHAKARVGAAQIHFANESRPEAREASQGGRQLPPQLPSRTLSQCCYEAFVCASRLTVSTVMSSSWPKSLAASATKKAD
jgi:hypothetical protein